jgi:hypothetical protein
MIPIRQSNADDANKSLVNTEVKAKVKAKGKSLGFESVQASQTNAQWLQEVGATDGVLLLGGAGVSHFRIRVAQSHARADLKPSCWSLAGILLDGQKFLSVPLEFRGEADEVGINNGVRTCNIADYDDPAQFPNIAVVRFTTDTEKILNNAKLIGGDPKEHKPAQRNILDLPSLMLPWLSYIWITGKANNPLVEELGLPSAAFVETVYGMSGIELTPGLASATSCPEAIWQAAKYWQEFYQEAAETSHSEDAAQQVPTGSYLIRQKAAAVTWP